MTDPAIQNKNDSMPCSIRKQVNCTLLVAALGCGAPGCERPAFFVGVLHTGASYSLTGGTGQGRMALPVSGSTGTRHGQAVAWPVAPIKGLVLVTGRTSMNVPPFAAQPSASGFSGKSGQVM